MTKKQTSTQYLALIDGLTSQLQKAWDTIAAVLAGRVQVSQAQIHDGDVLFFHPDSDERQETLARAVERLNGILKQLGKKGVALILLPAGCAAIDVVSPELMEEHGWQRKPSAAEPSPQPASATPTL